MTASGSWRRSKMKDMVHMEHGPSTQFAKENEKFLEEGKPIQRGRAQLMHARLEECDTGKATFK
jgi:hypothetical protein